MPAANSVNDRESEKPLRRLSEGRYKAMCTAGHTISRQVGNCYTAAVYMNLLSLVSNVGDALEGKRVLLFSYGSGAVATAFAVRARSPTGNDFTLQRIQQATGISARLAARTVCDVGAFRAAMDLRAARYGKAGYEPSGSIAQLQPGAYYLTSVDALHRRSYARKPKA